MLPSLACVLSWNNTQKSPSRIACNHPINNAVSCCSFVISCIFVFVTHLPMQRQTSTLRQREGRAPLPSHHVTEGGQPSRGWSAVSPAGWVGDPQWRHIHDSTRPSRRRRARPKKTQSQRINYRTDFPWCWGLRPWESGIAFLIIDHLVSKVIIQNRH